MFTSAQDSEIASEIGLARSSRPTAGHSGIDNNKPVKLVGKLSIVEPRQK